MNISFIRRGALALGGAAFLLSATVGSLAAQPTTPTHQQHRQAVINLAATELGLSGDQLAEALEQAHKDLGLNKRHPRIAKLVHQELSVAATTLGYSNVKTMRADLAGTTLADLAQKRNILPATVAAALRSDVDSRIQALVAAGTIKANQAATLKIKAGAKVDSLMTRQFKTKGVVPSSA